MAVGVGIPETLYAASQGHRANDPFGSKEGRDIPPHLVNRMTGISDELRGIGRPLVGDVSGVLRGELGGLTSLNDPITLDTITANPLFGSLKSAVEGSFDQARNRTIATGGEGGALMGALQNLETDRANALAQAFGQVALNEQGRRLNNFNAVVPQAAALGTNAFQGAISAINPLIAAQAAIAQANISGDASNKNAKMGFQSEQIQEVSGMAGAMMGGK